MSSTGGGVVVLVQRKGATGTPVEIAESDFRAWLQHIRTVKPDLYAELAPLIGDPVP